MILVQQPWQSAQVETGDAFIPATNVKALGTTRGTLRY